MASGPSGEDFVGRLNRAESSAWAPSRANDWRWSSRFSLGINVSWLLVSAAKFLLVALLVDWVEVCD